YETFQTHSNRWAVWRTRCLLLDHCLLYPSENRSISRLATEDALWINVDFSSENQNLRQKLLMWAQYRFFRISAGIEASRLFDSLYTTDWLANIGGEITRIR